MANPEQITEQMISSFITLCTERGYQIRKQIGEGSFGRTYLGIRREGTGSGSEEAYAIKLALDNATLHAYLERETSIQKTFDHENIVKVFEVFDGNGYKAIVMELMEISLFQYLTTQPGYCISESETREFTRQIVAGLLYIHKKGLTHRDIKPENILMKKNPMTGKWVLKIADFGFVKQSNAMTTTLGTPEYMAPDILSGGRYGPEVDLWALGCMVYFMLNGSLHTGHLRGEQLINFVKSSNAFELRDNEVKRFSAESKDFVKSLLTSDPAKRIRFDSVSSHPFLAPSFSFTVAINMPNNIPLVYNAPIDIRQLRTRPIIWENITNYISDAISYWKYTPPGSRLVAIFNGDIVNPKNYLDDALLKADAVNTYVFVQNSLPMAVDLSLANMIPDFNPQEVDAELRGQPMHAVPQVEANFYIKKKDAYISALSRAGAMRAEALRFVGELERGCQSYLNVYLSTTVADVNAYLPKVGVKESLPLMAAGGTKEMLEKTGAQDMSFMDAMRQDEETIRCFLRDPNARSRINAAFFKFRNQHLHVLANATKREMVSYLEAWNKIACLVTSLTDIVNLCKTAARIKESPNKGEIAKKINCYMSDFNKLMCKNQTWTQATDKAAAPGRMVDALQASIISDLQERLRRAEARIKKLEEEKSALQVSLKNAEDMLLSMSSHKV